MDDNDNPPQVTLSADEIKVAEKRVEQFLLMRPSTADYSAAEQFLYPDFPAVRLEYTDEEKRRDHTSGLYTDAPAAHRPRLTIPLSPAIAVGSPLPLLGAGPEHGG